MRRSWVRRILTGLSPAQEFPKIPNSLSASLPSTYFPQMSVLSLSPASLYIPAPMNPYLSLFLPQPPPFPWTTSSFSTISHLPRGQRKSGAPPGQEHLTPAWLPAFPFFSAQGALKRCGTAKNRPTERPLEGCVQFRWDIRENFLPGKGGMAREVLESHPWCHLIPDTLVSQNSSASASGSCSCQSRKHTEFPEKSVFLDWFYGLYALYLITKFI